MPGLPGAKGVAGIPGQPGREVIIPDLFPAGVIGSVLNTTLSVMERGETYFFFTKTGLMPFSNCQTTKITQTFKVCTNHFVKCTQSHMIFCASSVQSLLYSQASPS